MTAADTARIRSAFREAALGLMEWREPDGSRPFYAGWGEKPASAWRCPDAPPIVYRSFDKQGDVEPFDVSADWNERGI